ncbi:MAG: glycosyltransferase [Clostridia bacterium]|nr:glycosyltransferase [Clostridia bacterium]
MKKRILIVNNNMHIGGVQKALANLLNCVYGKYDISLLLFNPKGKLFAELPNNINIISVKSPYKYLGLSKNDVKRFSFDYFGRCFWALLCRILGRTKTIGIMSLFQKNIEGYDIVISFLHNGGEKAFYGGCNDFVLRHVKAEKKISVLHCDYRKCGANNSNNAKLYEKFDVIAACSEGCRNSFVSALPQYSEKTVILYNCHNFKRLDFLADSMKVELSDKYINIVTVARLGKEKGVLRAIDVISRLPDMYKQKIRYYIIGNGIEMEQALSTVKSNSLEDTVIFLGEMENPYSYVKAADLLLMSSYSEAAPLVIGEAAFFSTPVLSTETSSAVEMIQDTGFGWVTENNEIQLYNKLFELISNPDLIHEKSKSMQGKFNNNSALNQFDYLIG